MFSDWIGVRLHGRNPGLPEAPPAPPALTPDRAVPEAEALPALACDMRTALNTIVGFAQLLRLNAAADPLSPRQDRALREMEAAAGELVARLDEMADVAAADDLPPPALQRLDLRLAARQVCDGLAAQAHASGVDLACAPPAPGLQVVADAQRLRIVLRRLAADAVRRARPGQTVRIDVRRGRDHVAAVVHDGGDAPSDDGLSGPAPRLGFAAAQRLARGMGGEVFAAAAPCGPAAFGLRLPAAGAAFADDATARAVVLHVGGTAPEAALLRQAAALHGLALHVAETFDEGLALVQALLPDVILLDIDRRPTEALAFRQALDLNPEARDRPVLALTGPEPPPETAGFAGRVAKPLDLQGLVATIRGLMRA